MYFDADELELSLVDEFSTLISNVDELKAFAGSNRGMLSSSSPINEVFSYFLLWPLGEVAWLQSELFFISLALISVDAVIMKDRYVKGLEKSTEKDF